jgi:hypothetical protein
MENQCVLRQVYDERQPDRDSDAYFQDGGD